MSKFRSYSKPKPLTPEELAWFEEMIRLQTKSEPVQLEMKLDMDCAEFSADFDEEELPMSAVESKMY